MTPRIALRTATADAHQRVDDSFARFRLGEPAGYRAFLRAMASAFLPVEAALDAAGAADLLPDWPERRRSHALRADLEACGTDPAALLDQPPFASDAAMLGGIYVLEGSRLGGAILKRDVPSDAPQLFLGAAGPRGSWRRFGETLDARLADDHDLADAIMSAEQVFSLFLIAAEREAVEPVA